jgi:hypothetical protein
MRKLEDMLSSPSQEEVDRAFLTQMCYDGQMDDDEIDEFVEVIVSRLLKPRDEQIEALQKQAEELKESREQKNENREN